MHGLMKTQIRYLWSVDSYVEWNPISIKHIHNQNTNFYIHKCTEKPSRKASGLSSIDDSPSLSSFRGGCSSIVGIDFTIVANKNRQFYTKISFSLYFFFELIYVRIKSNECVRMAGTIFARAIYSLDK